MNILKSLLSNETIKQQILSKFISGFKEQGISKIVVEIGANDAINIVAVKDSEMLTDTREHEFLKDFYLTHKPY